MELSFEQRGDVRIARVKEAKFTYPVLSPFIGEMRRMVDQGVRKLIIDLEAVTYIDSASIGCLIEAHQLLTQRGGSLKVTGAKPRVHAMLSMVLVDKILDVHSEEAAALAAFGVSGSPADRALGCTRRNRRKARGQDTGTT